MKKVLAVVSALLIMSFAVGASAQVPNIQVYFGFGGSEAAHPAPCPGIGVIESDWHVILNNMNAFFNVVEYSISYPPIVVPLADIPDPDPLGNPALVSGFSGNVGGVALGWPIQMNGFSSVRVARCLVQWLCDTCLGSNYPVVVGPGLHGVVRVVTMPGNNPVTIIGMTSLLCATPVPVKDGTWGKVKALYDSN
jgi:hypothetical protein